MNITSLLPKLPPTNKELEFAHLNQIYDKYKCPVFGGMQKLFQSKNYYNNNHSSYTITFPICNFIWTKSNFKFLMSPEISNSFDIIFADLEKMKEMFDSLHDSYHYPLYFTRK